MIIDVQVSPICIRTLLILRRIVIADLIHRTIIMASTIQCFIVDFGIDMFETLEMHGHVRNWIMRVNHSCFKSVVIAFHKCAEFFVPDSWGSKC